MRYVPLLPLLGLCALALRAEPVPLVNPGGERNDGIDRTLIASPTVPGWDSNGGQVINDRTDYGNGGWRMSIEDSTAAWQLTPHAIAAGDAFSLRFDAALFSGSIPGDDFTPDLTLLGPGLLNGDFNADASPVDARNFTETPEWFNLGSAGDGSQATRNAPANTLLDGTRNAVISANSTRLFAIDTGYTLGTGEVFRVTYQWRDAANWNDGADRVGVSLFTTSDDSPTGTPSLLQTLVSELSTINGTYEAQASRFDPVPLTAGGKRLFLYFEGVDGNGDNVGFARLDDLVLQRGIPGPSTAPRSIISDLYIEQGAARQVVATRTNAFKSLTVGSWQHYHLAVEAGELDAHAGETLGIQFRSSPTSNLNFQSFDHVRLDHWAAAAPDGSFSDDWDTCPDQVWPGPGYWANRLHDWEVRNGRVNCILGSRDRRTVHRVGTSVRGHGGSLALSVRTGLHLGTNTTNARSGFLLGAGPSLDWRGALLVHDGLGRDFGLFLGLRGDGAATIEDYGTGTVDVLDTGAVPAGGFPASARLVLDAVYNSASGEYTLSLAAYDPGDTLFSSATATLPSDRLLGSLGLLSHKGGNNARFWFDDFSGSGSALQPEPDRHLAIVGAMYTLSRGVLKITAQLPPVDLSSTPPVTLETWNGGAWQQFATADIDNTDNLSSYTASFRIPGWDDTVDTDYRLGVAVDGTLYHWTGTVRRDPVDKNEIVIAATTCQRISDGSVQNNGFDWSPVRVWQPHTLAFTHLPRHQPDVFIANGDQIYEGQPTPEDSGNDFNRQHDYLYKWYLWVLQSRGLTRAIPTIAMPDDHDVFQGNLWGEGGIATTSQGTGGYEEPASWVKLVDRTQTSHLPDPDPYHPVQPAPPIAQGIGVYFTGMVYGGVGIAIIEDRKFKTGSTNPPADLDQQFLVGDRQKDFLRAWNGDWAGQQVKFMLSQSPLGNLHTHANTGYNFGLNDKDSHGWPLHRRNEVWGLLRQSRMFQVAGDQHLSTLAQHGILGPADAGYSFTLPAIANFFPRCWDPVHNANGTTATVNPYTGDFFFDGVGTLPSGQPNLSAADPAHVRMLAVGNPLQYYQQTRNISPANLHDRGAGYGIVRIDKTTRRIVFECWPLHADPDDPGTGTQYDDWPVTISQTDNDGRVPTGFLPVIDTQWEKTPVIDVYDESSGERVYIQRVRGNQFRPPVYDNGTSYRVEIAYGDHPASEVLYGQVASPAGPATLHAFAAIQPSVVEGESATLRWNVESPGTLVLDNGIGDVLVHTVDGIGYLAVSPASDTVYTLTLDGTQAATTTVRVFGRRATWNGTHFTPAELLDPLVSGDDADPDGDGFTNGQEFQFQRDPRDGAAWPQLEGSVVEQGGALYVAFRSPFPLQPEGFNLVVEVSDDLVSWTTVPANAYTETARDNYPVSGTAQITLRLNAPIPSGSSSRRYYRARWEL
jgi:hypothetical protein